MESGVRGGDFPSDVCDGLMVVSQWTLLKMCGGNFFLC
jgi:hypothetical protein